MTAMAVVRRCTLVLHEEPIIPATLNPPLHLFHTRTHIYIYYTRVYVFMQVRLNDYSETTGGGGGSDYGQYKCRACLV